MERTVPGWARILHHVVRVSAVAAFAALVVEFGFELDAAQIEWMHRVQIAVTALIVLDAATRLAVATDKRAHVLSHRLEAVLLVAIVVDVVAWASLGHRMGDRPIVLGAQIYLVFVAGLALARANEHLLHARVRPELLLLASFVVAIAVGAFLISLPRCRAPGAPAWTWLDALFTSTSAVCVTGLSVRDIGSELTFRGQAVVLALIQVGGLGLVVVAAVISVFQRSSMRVRELGTLHALFGVDDLGTLRGFLKYILAITAFAELAGAALLLRATDSGAASFFERMWWSLFHSVSAFCNAGFALQSDSVVGFARHPTVVLVLGGLIVAGGLGFPVWMDLLRYRIQGLSIVRRQLARWFGVLGSPSRRLSLHTRITLTTALVLVVGGAALFWIAERDGTLARLGARDGAINALFQSITARTAGFNSVDMGALGVSTSMLLIVLMAIGASPVSTGGGIKTSAIAVVFHTVRAMTRNREHVEVFGRSITRRVVNASVAVLSLYILAVLAVATALLVTQPRVDALSVMFETVSALSTVGLSRGVTLEFDAVGRAILCVAMLVGRVGPVALLWALLSRPPEVHYQLPSEKIMVS